MQRQFITKIFLIEDDAITGKTTQKALEQESSYDVTWFDSGEACIQNLYQKPEIVVIDYNLPGMSGIEILKTIRERNPEIITIILSGQQTAEVVVEAYDLGADHYIIKSENSIIDLKNSIKNLSKSVNLKKEVEVLRQEIIDRNKYHRIIGESQQVLKTLKMVQKVENNSILVMISGESGTGKELVANAIHYNSPRKKRSFIPVNIAAIPEDLIESELFGHEKGAFTGAVSRSIGKFEEANGGTIFLDEIGEIDQTLQTKLLRVLQDGKIYRLGSNREIQLDVRIVAATNKNLAQLVKDGKFREDLYYRLQGFLIHLPPLKERGNDIILLAKNFLQQFCEKSKMPLKSFTKEALEAMLNYSWPGNIRELKFLVERAALIADSDRIGEEDLVFSDLI